MTTWTVLAKHNFGASGIVKDRNGKYVEFETKEEAQQYAAACRDSNRSTQYFVIQA